MLLFYRNSAPPSEDQSTANDGPRNRTRSNNNRRSNGPRRDNNGPRRDNNGPRRDSRDARPGQAALRLENPYKVQRIVAEPPPPRRERDNNNNNQRGPRQVASASTGGDGKTGTRIHSPS